MSWLFLIVGILLTGIGGLAIVSAVAKAIPKRRYVRLMTGGERMPILGADLIFFGAWGVATIVGLWLIWKSQHM
jgi:hypothetical protein